MNEQYLGERVNPPEIVEGIDKRTTSPAVNSDPFADRVPVDNTLIYQAPMGGTVVAVAPLNAPLADEIPMYESPAHEIPMGGTVAAVGPMNEPLADETSTYETPVQKIPMNETMVHEVSIDEPVTYRAPVAETMADESRMSQPVLYMAPMDDAITHIAPVATNVGSSAALLAREESEHFRSRWSEIQGKFVDDPRSAVQQADTLVSEVIEHITQMFAKNHRSLEGQWNQGNSVSTEDLRKALQQYRSFFNRLVV